MSSKRFKLVVSLDSLMLLATIVGFILILTSCRTTDPLINSTDKTHNETVKSDTAYEGKKFDVKVPGEHKEANGDSIRVQVRDSVVIRDSVVYRYRDVDPNDYHINIPPLYARGQFGYAKAYVDNNKLFLFYIAHDRVVQHYIDSCVVKITTERYITDSIRITRNLINSGALRGGDSGDKPFMSIGGLILTIVIIVAVTLLLLSYRGIFQRPK